MSYTSLDIDPGVYGTAILVARTSGRALEGGALSARCFGLASVTDPYFEPAGAAPGELAQLGFDGASGTFFLLSGQAPDIHLMARQRVGAQRERDRARSSASAGVPDPQLEREQLLERWRAAGDHRRIAQLKAKSPMPPAAAAEPPTADVGEPQGDPVLERWRAADDHRRLAQFAKRRSLA